MESGWYNILLSDQSQSHFHKKNPTFLWSNYTGFSETFTTEKLSFELKFLQKQIISEDPHHIWSENSSSGIKKKYCSQYSKCLSIDRFCQRGDSPEFLWEPRGAELQSHLEDRVQSPCFQVTRKTTTFIIWFLSRSLIDITI